jgi:hypothetical protein
LVVVPPGDERAVPLEPDFTWIGPDTLEGRFRMDRPGSWRTLVETSRGEMKRGPAVTLPYSPEFDPREGQPTGAEVLAEVAELSGGVERPDVLDVLHDPPRTARMSSLLPWLLSAGIVLLILEIAGRRLSLWERITDAASAGVPEMIKPRAWLPRWHLPRLMPTLRTRRAKTTDGASAAADAADASPPPSSRRPSAPATNAEPKPALDVFAAAKEKAKRRLK